MYSCFTHNSVGFCEQCFEEGLKEAFRKARSADAWEDTAAQAYRDADFYRGIVIRIGEPFGVAAKTSDDGSIQENVLALRVPELVEGMRAELQAAKTAVGHLFKTNVELVLSNNELKEELASVQQQLKYS